MKLIDKDSVVTEIKRYKHKIDERLKIKGRTLAEDCKDSALQNLCGNLLYFIDTLEVKEVDLEKENIIGTIEREVKIDAGGYPYINCDIEFYDYDKDIPLAKEGDKVKVIIVKGE